ncbi:MAG TPA: hypothetical protein VH814_19410 [Steroidobacteraceae bacterium]
MLALLGFWIASRAPSYLPPPGDQIDILLELAGVFPDKYAIMWREHGILRATDAEAQQDPALLRRAEFMHNLTTGGPQSEGDIHVEVAYRFYAHDHQIRPDATLAPSEDTSAADQSALACVCNDADPSTLCEGQLAFGNYQFTLSVSYNHEQCRAGVNPEREKEFRSSLQTASRLIHLYLEPLRRKPRWL